MMIHLKSQYAFSLIDWLMLILVVAIAGWILVPWIDAFSGSFDAQDDQEDSKMTIVMISEEGKLTENMYQIENIKEDQKSKD